ncbi:MAG: ferredoxin [Candidatus Saganbacteria bacterium]|nr:ferredoxin [Candidatus Saganbacteria bacterium]
MQIKVDDSLCIGCGICVDECGKVFSMNADGKAVVQSQDPGEIDMEELSDRCPVDAIEVEK